MQKGGIFMSKKIIIIGVGIAGLTAEIYGLKANYDVEIYEKIIQLEENALAGTDKDIILTTVCIG